MGAAFFIVLERKVDGVDAGMGGKSLSAHIESLDEAARQLGARPLSEFFRAGSAQLAEFMEDEGVGIADTLPPRSPTVLRCKLLKRPPAGRFRGRLFELGAFGGKIVAEASFRW